jgi:hypothetical protein
MWSKILARAVVCGALVPVNVDLPIGQLFRLPQSTEALGQVDDVLDGSVLRSVVFYDLALEVIVSLLQYSLAHSNSRKQDTYSTFQRVNVGSDFVKRAYEMKDTLWKMYATLSKVEFIIFHEPIFSLLYSLIQ